MRSYVHVPRAEFFGDGEKNELRYILRSDFVSVIYAVVLRLAIVRSRARISIVNG